MEIKKLLSNVNRTIANNRAIKYIVIHYVGAVSTAYNNAKYFENTDRQASAHYFVDENEIYQIVEDKNISWHCGSNKYYCDARNSNSIGIEMCCIKKDGKLDISDKVIERAIELVKELIKKYNIDVEHVIRHYDISHKICPAPFVNDISRWNDFKNKLGQTDNSSSRKSNEQIANEVIQGKWGNGTNRKNALINAGYDFNAIQNIVNQKLTGKTESKPSLKSIETIAKEVIAGAWGNGENRKNRLTSAGYNYSEVQNKVNELCGVKSIVINRKSNEEIASEVIAGKWGNGETRKQKLQATGYDFNKIQSIVNQKLK